LHFVRHREDALLQLAQVRRQRRAGEWTESKAVTFIVTLAAGRSVTLAAARAGMSRKSAYALKCRDARFAAAWAAAIAAGQGRAQGDKVGEVDDPRFNGRRGNKKARTSSGSFDAMMRDFFFATISNHPCTACPAPLARADTLP
jgi:hypothetical protein